MRLNTSLPPSWTVGKDGRRAKVRASHKGGWETPLRLTAGYVLLAGICSLMVSQERLPSASLAWETDSVAAARNTRKPAMDSQERTTLFAGPEFRTAAGYSGHSVQPDPLPPPADTHGVARMAGMVGDGIGRLEGLIAQYPWPTVLFGIGLGFLFARRMR